MTPEILEIEFKGNKRLPYFNPKSIQVKPGDYVVVEADKGIDLGRVSKLGRLVALTRIKGTPKNVIRKAVPSDLEKLKENREKEAQAFLVGREKIKKHNLNMKLVDVEYQFDNNKLTFYFTSEKRVDFRALVRDLAAKYRTRIELRQIGVRDEARRLGGLGVCGKPLCCSFFLREFEPITTQFARMQHLPLNPSKLTGVCGRLKCCLLYEKDFYESSLQKFPVPDTRVITDRGEAVVEKVDIFKELIYLRFSREDDLDSVTLQEFQNMLKEPAYASKNV